MRRRRTSVALPATHREQAQSHWHIAIVDHVAEAEEHRTCLCLCGCEVWALKVYVIVFETHKTHDFPDSCMYRSVGFELSSKSKHNFCFSLPFEHSFVQFGVNIVGVAQPIEKYRQRKIANGIITKNYWIKTRAQIVCAFFGNLNFNFLCFFHQFQRSIGPKQNLIVETG